MKEKEERCSAAVETQVIRVSTRPDMAPLGLEWENRRGGEIEKYCLGAHWGLV